MEQKYWSEKQIEEYLKEIEKRSSIEDLKADMHNHTTGSDGTQSPLMFLLRAHNRGINTVSISDHKTTKGYKILIGQVEDILDNLEEIEKREDLSVEEKEKSKKGATRLLKVLESMKLLPACELITVYNGCPYVEVLSYGADNDILEEEMEKLNKGLASGAKVLLDGTYKVIEENNLVFDTFVIDNRNDFRKLFFHELIKHPENESLYKDIEGETEEEQAENFAKKYLENPESPLYVDMSDEDKTGRTKVIRRNILEMLKKNENIVFDQGVIEQSHAVTGEFYNELIKHPENQHLIGKDITNLKTFIYKGLYNYESPFFIDMSSTRPPYEATIDAIHKAGGKAFLAHVIKYNRTLDVKKEMEEGDFLDKLDGVEVFYPDHDIEFQEYLLNICREKGKLASGGSDDHLAPKDGEQYVLGTVNVPDIEQTKWIEEMLVDGRDIIKDCVEMRQLRKRLSNLAQEKKERQKENTSLEIREDELKKDGEEIG